MVDWPVWVNALEERDRVECWISGFPLWDRRKRPTIHFDWITGYRAVLVEVSSPSPKIVSDVAARNLSTSTDAAAANASLIAAATCLAGCSESAAALVDAA